MNRAAVKHLCQSNGMHSKLLASVGKDKCVYIHDTSVLFIWGSEMQSNELVRSYKANGHVYDMSFNATGDLLCLATQESQVYILDIRVLIVSY